MYMFNCCVGNKNYLSWCHKPLIEVCDTTSQINLDLVSCEPCSKHEVYLMLEKAGCPEYEVVCEPRPQPCCGVIDARPMTWGQKRVIEKPRARVFYPLHEINSKGLSVFVLDEKIKELGYGRVKGEILLVYEPLPTNREFEITDFVRTGIEIYIDYLPYKIGFAGVGTRNYLNLAEC